MGELRVSRIVESGTCIGIGSSGPLYIMARPGTGRAGDYNAFDQL